MLNNFIYVTKLSCHSNINAKPNLTYDRTSKNSQIDSLFFQNICFFLFRSKLIINSSFSGNCGKWITSYKTSNNRYNSIQKRSIYTTTNVFKKKEKNTEELPLVHKTNQRSTNKKTIFERKIKTKPTVWGIIDVYRFITVEKLASLMNKSIGKLQTNSTFCLDIQ